MYHQRGQCGECCRKLLTAELWLFPKCHTTDKSEQPSTYIIKSQPTNEPTNPTKKRSPTNNNKSPQTTLHLFFKTFSRRTTPMQVSRSKASVVGTVIDWGSRATKTVWRVTDCDSPGYCVTHLGTS